jgi:hypothetical protein
VNFDCEKGQWLDSYSVLSSLNPCMYVVICFMAQFVHPVNEGTLVY